MPRSPFRAPVAAVSALALGATVFLVGGTASASLPGSGSVLTSSNGQTSIRFHGDPSRTSLNSPDTITDGAWSPDGSQAVYVDQTGRIMKLRFDDGTARYLVTAGRDHGALRRSPSWFAGGNRLAWAEKVSATAPWRVVWHYSTTLPYGDSPISRNDGRHYLNPDGGRGPRVVFQRQEDNGSGQPTGRAAVMLYDGSESANPGLVTLVDEDGSNPAISPDESRVAFVRAGQIVTSDLAGQNEVTVTPEGVRYDDPTWSPDGRTLAFTRVTSTGARPVHTAPADGSSPPVPVPGLDGVSAYQPHRKDLVARISGPSRFDTAVAVSRARWADGEAMGVVLTRSDTYADALSGAALAAAKGGPLLLTPPDRLDAKTKAEIQRVALVGHSTIYLLGSTGALSKAVEDEIRAMGYHVLRIAGADRFATSVEIAKVIAPKPDVVLLATGMNYPDALAAGAAAGAYNTSGSSFTAAVVLTQDYVLPPVTRTFLDSLPDPGRTLYGIGEQAGLAVYEYNTDGGSDVRGVWGKTRYETAHLVALEFFDGPAYAGFATGTDWPDALTGGALMGTLGGPLMLVPGTDTSLGSDAVSLLKESSGSMHTGLVFGSPGVVGPAPQAQIGTLLGGPLGSSSLSNPSRSELGLAVGAGTDRPVRGQAG